MKKTSLVILALISLHCAKTDYFLKNVNSKVRLTPFTQEEGYVLKRRFEVSHTRVNAFWGLATVYKKDMETVLSPEFRDYEKNAVGDLTITETYEFWDSLVDFILIGLIRPYTVVFSGNIYEKVSDSTTTEISESNPAPKKEKANGKKK